VTTVTFLCLLFAVILLIWIVVITWPFVDKEKAKADLAAKWVRLKNVFSGPRDT